MKKRARITALVTTLCLCLSLFVVGVLAATSASLSVTSTLNFTADGVYVMVDASLKQGADVANAAVLSGEGAPTGQTTYKAYSYPRASGQDYPNGEPSTTYFVNESGAQANTWAIGDINYTSTNKVVVYEFTVSNYSPFEVQGTVQGISEALATYVEQGQLTITTYTGTSSSSATATGSPTYSFTIPARTNETTPGTTCYKIAVTLNDFMNSLATGEIEMDVSFTEKQAINLNGITYTGENHATLAPSSSNNFIGGANTGSSATWSGLQASLTETNKAVKYRMEVTNNTEAGIKGVGNFTIANQTTPEPSLVAGGVNTYEFTNYTVTEYAQYIQNIQPNDTQVYELVVELNQSATSATINVSINFNFTDDKTYSIEWEGNTYNYVNMGKYPQRYVGNTMNVKLEALLSSNDASLVETGKIYTTFNDCNLPSSTSAKDATPILVESKEYTYIDGNKYVRMETPDFYSSSYTYMNGETVPAKVQSGDTTKYPAQWYKVEPIQWRVLTENYKSTGLAMLLSESALSANTSFYPTNSSPYGDINNYARSDNAIRNYLTTYFYNQALTSEEQAKVTGRNFTEGELEYNGVDEADITSALSDQKVWLPTRADYINSSYGFSTSTGTDDTRLCSPSDFALANYSYLYTSSTYTTPARQNGGIVQYWTSSAASASFAYYVTDNGYVSYDLVNSETYAARPALLFKLAG